LHTFTNSTYVKPHLGPLHVNLVPLDGTGWGLYGISAKKSSQHGVSPARHHMSRNPVELALLELGGEKASGRYADS
jgi:hypothetical protein